MPIDLTYIILTENNIYSLEKRVSKYMREGWCPTGGLTYIEEYGSTSYMQAVYLVKPEIVRVKNEENHREDLRRVRTDRTDEEYPDYDDIDMPF